jgi:hypothetical protein
MCHVSSNNIKTIEVPTQTNSKKRDGLNVGRRSISSLVRLAENKTREGDSNKELWILLIYLIHTIKAVKEEWQINQET